MKKIYLIYFFAVWQVSAQQMPEACGSAKIHNEKLRTDSVYAKKMADFESRMLRELANRSTTVTNTYVVPIVVHVMHKGEEVGSGTNVSDQAIYDRIKLINDNFRKSVGGRGYGSGVDTGIEFALAVRTPDGQCTNGITRRNMSNNPTYMNYGVSIEGDGIPLSNIKALDAWDRHEYFNLWLISEFDNNEGGSGYQGISSFASSHGQFDDGIVVLAASFAEGFISDISNTETHEFGHALNLYHTFEGDAGGGLCPVGNGCGGGNGDCCPDTPPHKRSPSICNLTGLNSCDGNSPNLLFAQNYMDYSYPTCKFMFTNNQSNRMVVALTAVRSSFLGENGNLSLVPSSAPIANYSTSSETVCKGEPITFTDRSSCIPNTYLNNAVWPGISFNWTFTNGATVVSSAQQNPTLRFMVPGNYNLSYTVTTPLGSNTKTITDAIIVTDSETAIACAPTSNFVGFSGNSVFNVVFNTIDNFTPQGHNEGYRDFTCTNNTTVTAGQTYNLNINASTGLYKYTENLEAYIDYNNNGLFETSERVMQKFIGLNDSFSEQTQSVVIPLTAVTNTFLRMRIIGSSGDITDGELNCNTVLPVGDVEDYAVKIIPALSNPEVAILHFTYFPNPVKNQLHIESDEDLQNIRLYSVLGQLLLETHATGNQIDLDLSSFTSGIYLVSLQSNSKTSGFKVIKN